MESRYRGLQAADGRFGVSRRQLVVAAGAALGTGRARAQSTIELKLAHGAAEDNPRHEAALLFASRVAQSSAGRIKVTVFPSSKLGDDKATLQGVLDGRIDMTANSQGVTAAVVPEYEAIGLPYIFETQQQVWRVLTGPVGEELRRRSLARGLRVLGFWDNGFRHTTTSRTPIRTPADMVGLKIRTPPDPVTAALVRALGAEPVVIPFSELPQALETRRADGQENPLINIYTAKLYAVQRYLALTNHKVELTPFLMSESAWNGLSVNDRSLVRAAGEEATYHQRQAMFKAEERCFSRLARENMQFTHIDTTVFRKATMGVVAEWSKGPIGAFTQMLIAAAAEARRG